MTTQPLEEQLRLVDRLVTLDLQLKQQKSEINRLQAELNMRRNDVASLVGRLKVSSQQLKNAKQEIKEVKHSRSQYFRALHWLICNKLTDIEGMPNWLVKALGHVVKTADSDLEAH